MTSARVFLLAGAINGFLTVALGAFGAHGLKAMLTPTLLATFHTGATYHGLHSLALFLTGLLALQTGGRAVSLAGWFFLGGIILFSGSLYLLATTGIRSLGMVTPIGGLAFLAGWISLGIAAWNTKDVA